MNTTSIKPITTREEALSLVMQNGSSLRELPDNFKNDKDIVLAAVQDMGIALYFASKELQADRDIVFEAVTQNGGMLQYVLPMFKNDKELVLISIKQHGQHLQYASVELRQDKNFILDAININDSLLDEFSNCNFSNKLELLDDYDIILAAVRKNGRQLYSAGPVCKNNKEIVLTAVYETDRAYLYCSAEMRHDPAVLFVCTKRNMILDTDWPTIKRALIEKPDYFLNPEPYMKALTDGMENPYLILAQYALNKDLVIESESLPKMEF